MSRYCTPFAACVAINALMVSTSVQAQPVTTHQSRPEAQEGRSDRESAHGSPHENALEHDIVVVGHPPTDFGLLAATASLGGDALAERTRAQIGDILNSLPGVSSTSFAPGASRPVLRGLSGDRVSVLTDGIGSLDASNVSVDHAVVFDALTVDHIDVYHGPSILLFGGNAIGGAVNALDKRIPRHVPEAVTGSVVGTYGTAARERALGGGVEIPLGDRFVAHVDGSWRESDDLRVGGNIYSSSLRDEMLEVASELRAEGELAEAAELESEALRTGRIAGSATRTSTMGAGIAFIDERGSLGVSYQRFDTRYGVPSRPLTDHHHHEEVEDGEHHGHEHGEAPVSIDLVQDRFDLRGELKLGGLIESLQIRGAYADYRHVEYEGDETGTIFDGEGIEARADLIQTSRNSWRGRSGFQYLSRELAVTGPEAVVPDYEIGRLGLFTLQSLELGGGLSVEASGRYDRSHIRSQGADYERSFDLWSGAVGAAWKSPSGYNVGANFVHGARAPSPEELLSDGIHIATQAYELGERTLGVEKSNGIEAYVRYDSPRFAFSLTGYYTDFDSYIVPLATGESRHGQPAYRYAGVDAVFKGFEATGRITAANWSDGSLAFDAGADYTHARIRDLGPVPRIPPLRIRGGSELRFGALRLRGEVEWNAAQERVGAHENATDAFTLVNLGADWHPMGEEGPITLMLTANNLFDVVGRRAASFTRDFAPIPGRDVRITTKFTF